MDRPHPSVRRAVLAFLVDDDGPTAVEYAVMLGLILMSVIAGVLSVGGATGGMYSGIDSNLQSHGFGS